MHDPTDETLMAYADGLLDEAQSRALEARLAEDAALRARLEPFVVTGKPLARLYERALSNEFPDRLVDAIFSGAKPVAAPAPDRKPLWSPFGSFGMLRLTGALAAGLAVGVIAGWFVRGEGSTAATGGALMIVTPRGNYAKGELAQVLETSPSGKISASRDETGGRLVIKPDLTFLAQDGAVCRQYGLETSDGAFGGVACRAGDGWRVDIHAPAPKAATAASGTVRPASGDQVPAAISGALDKMMASDPLTVQQEDELMKSGWRQVR
jgi:anti-sigma factor RsiW